ncbi:hypothetical protein PLICRDRAFT_112998 [Plicaturopsis crispa FD-325 SS-3]|nr:hypothetical protein PLICRDRAFT_112998 [Plicaturopsis crispa FD-325 SS-3]
MYADEAGTSAKRKRVDETDNSPSSSRIQKRSSDFWYHDGSVILEAESTQFRVHIGVLAEQSPVFKDMLQLSEPVTEGSVDACPVVHLSDSAMDLNHFLRAVYKWRLFSGQTKTPLPTLAAFLRLGKKYSVEHIYIYAHNRISGQYSSSIDIFRSGGNNNIVKYKGMEFDLARLLRETGTLSPLPFVFYSCGQNYSTAELLDGFKPSGPSLDAIDRTTCLLGLEKLRAEALVHLRAWENTQPGCLSPEICEQDKAKVIIALSARTYNFDAFQCFDTDWEADLCTTCRTFIQADYDANRRLLWRKLPSFFGLPDGRQLT